MLHVGENNESIKYPDLVLCLSNRYKRNLVTMVVIVVLREGVLY